MANSSARLPAVEPFDLNDPTPTSAAMGGFDPNLETELLTDLEAGAARVAEPVPLSSPEDGSAGRLKFRSRQPQETSKWNSLDPELVARRVAQLRRPQARARGRDDRMDLTSALRLADNEAQSPALQRAPF